ncbi:Eco57I restriction-modification methylase domain-containing protein [Candidatus Peribacteria bacterium]|nr:MAG: Eco57I restriction-modification methylase domain-containing protein [Candidatus Peribacteria bacterium]
MIVTAQIGKSKAIKLPKSILYQVEALRIRAALETTSEKKSSLGQFFTPAPIAHLLASMFEFNKSHLSLLDAGAGVGNLSIACIQEICKRSSKTKSIKLTAFEVDTELLAYLEETYKICALLCKNQGIKFEYEIINSDFIKDSVQKLQQSSEQQLFDCVVMNPPYKKIHSQSDIRFLLREVGIETGNLYAGFLAVAMKLLKADGQMVAITPRSFCNGPYFRPFRELFLKKMALSKIHIFESRKDAFKEDAVLQENIIFSAFKNREIPFVQISSSNKSVDAINSSREIPYSKVINPNDPEMFIHIIPNEIGDWASKNMNYFNSSLSNLGLKVSTGKVVDFRAKEFLRGMPESDTVPLIFPTHFSEGKIHWPKMNSKKPNAIIRNINTEPSLISNERYVIVKRFSSKEEKRRIVAVIYEPSFTKADLIGFENHLNYFHMNGVGLDENLAKGIFVFLNSTLVDTYFRLFNGHTQVNATDLNSIKYPSLEELRTLGKKTPFPISQETIDALVQKELLNKKIALL